MNRMLVALLAPPLLLPAAPAGAAAPSAEAKAIVEELVACGTRHSLSSWTDPKRGIGCGRDAVVRRFDAVEKATGGKLRVVVDSYETTGPRTKNVPVHMENVYAILGGTDPVLAKTAFVVSGHYDSMPSSVMDSATDAPGADDDASGTAASILAARALARDARARDADLRGRRRRGAGPPRREADARVARDARLRRRRDDHVRHRRRDEREHGQARPRLLRGRTRRDRLARAADGAPRRGRERKGRRAPRLPARPVRARRRPPAVHRGGPSRRALHRAARGLPPRAPDAAHRERRRVRRPREVHGLRLDRARRPTSSRRRSRRWRTRPARSSARHAGRRRDADRGDFLRR